MRAAMARRSAAFSPGCRKQWSTEASARSASCLWLSLKAPAARAYSLDSDVANTPLSSVHSTTGCPARTLSILLFCFGRRRGGRGEESLAWSSSKRRLCSCHMQPGGLSCCKHTLMLLTLNITLCPSAQSAGRQRPGTSQSFVIMPILFSCWQ